MSAGNETGDNLPGRIVRVLQPVAGGLSRALVDDAWYVAVTVQFAVAEADRSCKDPGVGSLYGTAKLIVRLVTLDHSCS